MRVLLPHLYGSHPLLALLVPVHARVVGRVLVLDLNRLALLARLGLAGRRKVDGLALFPGLFVVPGGREVRTVSEMPL